jgi:hypothetical protein
VRALRPLARTADLRTERLGDELIVRGADGQVGARLNHTAAVVWKNSDGRRTVAELAEILRAEVGDVADEDLVLTALDGLQELGLIESGYPRREKAAVRMTRRRFIGRVGIASAAALALPVVQSLVAPTVAGAAPRPEKKYYKDKYYYGKKGYYSNYYYGGPPGYYP